MTEMASDPATAMFTPVKAERPIVRREEGRHGIHQNIWMQMGPHLPACFDNSLDHLVQVEMPIGGVPLAIDPMMRALKPGGRRRRH